MLNIKYLYYFKINPFELIFKVLDEISKAPLCIQSIFKGFQKDTEGELFETPELLFEFYEKDENYQALSEGELGSNVLFKYTSLTYVKYLQEWIEFLHIPHSG